MLNYDIKITKADADIARYKRQTKMEVIVDRLKEMGAGVYELDWKTAGYKTAYVLPKSINQYCKQQRITNILAFTRDHRCYVEVKHIKEAF